MIGGWLGAGAEAGQQGESGAEPGHRQGRAARPPQCPGPVAGPDAPVQPLLLLGIEGGLLPGVAHHVRQFPLEVVHRFSLHPTGLTASDRICRSRATPLDAWDRAVPTGQPRTCATWASGRSSQ
ncbi:hypothetical protein SHIRM173S_07186 [Streptomyces hirsutus]